MRQHDTCLISALTGQGLDNLICNVEAQLNKYNVDDNINLSHGDGKKRAWLYSQGVVRNERPTENGCRITISWSERQKLQFQSI